MTGKIKCGNKLLDLSNLIKNNVLPFYNLSNASLKQVKIKNTDKQRAVYKVTYNNINYCLKKVYYDEGDLLFMYSAMEWLYRNNIKVPRILPTSKKSRFVKADNMIFILTPWIEGEKCDFDSSHDIRSSIINLAYIHKYSKEFIPIEGSNIKTGYDNIYISLTKHFHKILLCSNEAYKVNDKFSKLYLSYFDFNFKLAKYSSDISSSLNFINLTRALCHGDYVNKNIILQNDDVWVIDFDKCCYDFVSQDISYFLRRLLKRSSTKWDIDIAKDLICSYNNINPLTSDDLKYILVYLAFPQKYWRTAKDYYTNIKVCNKSDFYELLSKTVDKTKYHLYFVKALERFIVEEFSLTL